MRGLYRCLLGKVREKSDVIKPLSGVALGSADFEWLTERDCDSLLRRGRPNAGLSQANVLGA